MRILSLIRQSERAQIRLSAPNTFGRTPSAPVDGIATKAVNACTRPLFSRAAGPGARLCDSSRAVFDCAGWEPTAREAASFPTASATGLRRCYVAGARVANESRGRRCHAEPASLPALHLIAERLTLEDTHPHKETTYPSARHHRRAARRVRAARTHRTFSTFSPLQPSSCSDRLLRSGDAPLAAASRRAAHQGGDRCSVARVRLCALGRPSLAAPCACRTPRLRPLVRRHVCEVGVHPLARRVVVGRGVAADGRPADGPRFPVDLRLGVPDVRGRGPLAGVGAAAGCGARVSRLPRLSGSRLLTVAEHLAGVRSQVNA